MKIKCILQLTARAKRKPSGMNVSSCFPWLGKRREWGEEDVL